MARIRSVKPEFFTSVTVAELTRDARLTWIGLWTHVDDAGRCPDDPRLIKAALFALDDDLDPTAVEALLVELSTAGRIVRYEVDGRRYLEVVGFLQHQRIDRPKPSRCPPRSIDDPSTTRRRSIDDPSSPDQDQGSGIRDQGSDQDGRPIHLRPVDEDLVDRVVSGLVDIRAIGKRGSYRMTVRSNILAGPELDDIRRAVINAGTTDVQRIIAYHEARRPRYDTPEPTRPTHEGLRALDVTTAIRAAGGMP